MKTLATIFCAALVLTGCDFDIKLGHKSGNGNVVTQERPVSENFEKIKAASGLEVILTAGTEPKIVVEADENLLPFIETGIVNGTLTITTSENIGSADSKKVHVTFRELSSVTASSGSTVRGNAVIKNESLYFKSSSGAELEAEVFAKEITAKSSSGADLTLKGKATSLVADASSGSELDASKLLVVNCESEASSGASLLVNVKTELKTRASSGGEIKYSGNPTEVSNNDSRSGSVEKM